MSKFEILKCIKAEQQILTENEEIIKNGIKLSFGKYTAEYYYDKKLYRFETPYYAPLQRKEILKEDLTDQALKKFTAIIRKNFIMELLEEDEEIIKLADSLISV